MINGKTPAYPLKHVERWVNPSDPSEGTYDAVGMTKREHLAGLALQGLLANPNTGDSALWGSPEAWVANMAETSVEMADTLLRKLEL